MAKGYTTVALVQGHLGRPLSAEQIAYLNDLVIPAVEAWVDSVSPRPYGESVVVGEQLVMTEPYTWLSKAPITSIQQVRGYLWGQLAADIAVIPETRYSLIDARTGYLFFPYWPQYEYAVIDYTPDPTIPENIRLASTILAGVYMRIPLHPQSEWLTDFASATDVRLKFRSVEIPQVVYDLIGGNTGGFAVA